MTMYEDAEIGAVRAAALEHAGMVATRPEGVRRSTPEEAARDRLRLLGAQQIAPSAGVAEAMIALGYQPVPVDGRTLQPAAPPLTSYADAMAHYFAHPEDGAGITLGARQGSFLVAVRAAPAAWGAWCRVHASETMDRGGEGGPGVVTEPKYIGGMQTCRWSPPAARVRTGRVVVGVGAQLEEADDFVYGGPRKLHGEIGWLVWSVSHVWAASSSDPARPVTFTNRRLDGIEVVASGVLPVHVVRPSDGWTLMLDSVPPTMPMPEYLIAALGGKVGKPAAA